MMIKSKDICNWGIIGGGDVCEHKGGPPLYKLEGCNLIGLTRRNREAGKDFARRHGPCQYFESVESLVANTHINCIYVASPPSTHLEHVLACAKAGKHVLCEKPMSVDSEECSIMVEACSKANVVLAVAYYRRGYPAVQRVKDIVECGELGALNSIWLNTQFPISHRLDLVQFFGGGITTVELETSETNEPFLQAATDSGAAIQTCLGFEETTRTEQIRLGFENGEVFIHDLKGGALTIHVENDSKEEVFDSLPYTHWGLVANFRDHLRNGNPLLCDGETGRATSVVLDEISNLTTPGQTRAIDLQNPAPYQPDQGKKFSLLV